MKPATTGEAVDAGLRRHDEGDGLQAAFAASMVRLGPFGPHPKFCAAVSGGADSTALVLLAQRWLAAAGGTLTALIVDHGIRSGSAAEAELTRARLTIRGIGSRILTLSGLSAGPRLQELARAARYKALAAGTRGQGAVFLLLGHHQADQAETVAMRAARGTGGLEGMASWTARDDVLLLRPLLGMRPARLRAFLRLESMPWVEDPSNTDRRFERIRLRQDGVSAIAAKPDDRMAREREGAAFLARHVLLRPEGFAVIQADSAPPAALAALLRVIGGNTYAPPQTAVAALAAGLKPASLGGVLIAKSGKFSGWLLAREFSACAPPVAAQTGARWDNRFRLLAAEPDATFGALGDDAAKFRDNNLPALVLRASPCLRRGSRITFPAPAAFTPPQPAFCHPFS